MDAAKAVFIFFGISMIFYAVFEFVLAVKFSKVFKMAEQEAAVEAAKAEATDVEVIESKPLIEEAAEEPGQDY